MAQPTNAYDRYDLNSTGDSVRESLSDVIYNIDPTETPFQSMCSQESSPSDYIEWQIDGYAAASTSNAHIDGDDHSGDALTDTKRLGNYHQISRKDLVVTRRADKLTKAGRKSELAYQLAKAGAELKRDMEAILTQPQPVTVGNSSTAPKTASLPAWIRTNVDLGATASAPTLSSTTYGYPNAAATNGTDRAVTEDELLALIKSAYTSGGNPSCIMVSPAVKQVISKYMFGSSARVATPYQDHKSNPRDGLTVAGAVDYYVSDFGTFEVIPNRFQRDDELFILQKDMWAISFIDKMKTVDIAKSGDSEKRLILCDYALKSKQEAANAMMTDIDEAAAMTAS